MITFVTIVHVIVSVFLVLVVLLQQGKGQDIAGAFGGEVPRRMSASAVVPPSSTA